MNYLYLFWNVADPPVARAEIDTVLGGEGCLVDVVCQVEGEEESLYITLSAISNDLLNYFEIVESN